MQKPVKAKKKPFSNIQRTSRGLGSYAQASHITGYSVEDMKLWKRNGCPAFRNSTVYIDELEEWLKGEGIDGKSRAGEGTDLFGEPKGTPEEVNRERVKKMRLEQRKLDREHEVQTGLLVYREEVKADLAAIMDQLTGILKKTCDRQQFNAISKQFAQVDFRKLGTAEQGKN